MMYEWYALYKKMPGIDWTHVGWFYSNLFIALVILDGLQSDERILRPDGRWLEWGQVP